MLADVVRPLVPVTVRPRLGEWAALPLIPFAVWYGCAVALGIGMAPAEGDRAAFAEVLRGSLALAVPLSALVVARMVWTLGQSAHWTLDRDGLVQGRWRPVRYPYAEIEALFVGLPSRDSTVSRAMARVPLE